MTRGYRLGRRQASVDQTAHAILAAARDLFQESGGAEVSVAAIARRAGVTRVTVYNRFGSRSALLSALAPPDRARPSDDSDPRAALRGHLQFACATWAADPALYRHLPTVADRTDTETPRRLAEALAAADALRPGCSLKEAQDVISVLGSFAVFDRLHQDGRRTPTAVAEMLMRLAGGILG
ncbi:MAG TPA: helix-turn-helix domain-containing protein [Candidatus Dormibacteraeota bacterium]|nr:helix-turn-helix domain-containing protein [Candidatus Dormibacteraeota bacterium]